MYGTNIHDAVQYKRKTKTQTHIKFGTSALYETLVNRLSWAMETSSGLDGASVLHPVMPQVDNLRFRRCFRAASRQNGVKSQDEVFANKLTNIQILVLAFS